MIVPLPAWPLFFLLGESLEQEDGPASGGWRESPAAVKVPQKPAPVAAAEGKNSSKRLTLLDFLEYYGKPRSAKNKKDMS
jgi:hypothetical protein